MIFINLLPHREAARKRKREAFNLMMGVSALIGGLIAGSIFLWYQAQISEQQDKIKVLQKENTKLDGQIKDIAGLRAEISALKARQQAVEDLQSDRNLPVHMLDELVKQLPDGVYLTSLKQENQTVSLQGVAQSNDRISDLLRNLANNTPWLSKPDLVDIVADSVTLGPRDVRRAQKFNLRVKLVRTSEAQKSIAVPTQPVAGSSSISSTPIATSSGMAKPRAGTSPATPPLAASAARSGSGFSPSR